MSARLGYIYALKMSPVWPAVDFELRSPDLGIDAIRSLLPDFKLVAANVLPPLPPALLIFDDMVLWSPVFRWGWLDRYLDIELQRLELVICKLNVMHKDREMNSYWRLSHLRGQSVHHLLKSLHSALRSALIHHSYWRASISISTGIERKHAVTLTVARNNIQLLR
ncbi:hypothetical protein FIBSPDRAFT_883627 [Athelia psychrophila]|uniref:Uncharacterized protein n=1 Tax=Athelia psychrophila TaxID=1759441 RepID=A0A166TRA0_9AGAM|nr:hypothetical protein FIBSPDRAFT_883627 [Fibularhizoctonia sp. CBS 109695]